MDDELKSTNKKGLDWLRNWWESFQSAVKVASYVQKAIEQKEWETEVLSSMPEAAGEIPHENLLDLYSSENKVWFESLPQMPNYRVNVETGVAFNTTAGSATYEFVNRANTLPDDETQAWAREHVKSYAAIQQKHQRAEDVRSILGGLNPKLAQEFEDARSGYRLGPATGDRKGAAFAMRTVLHHLKGELQSKARNRPQEQKVSWIDMANRLGKGGPGSTECQALILKEEKWKSLSQRLTWIGKNDPKGAIFDMEAVFTDWIDLLYSFLLLIDRKYIQ